MIEHGEGTTEYRFRHRRGHYIWISRIPSRSSATTKASRRSWSAPGRTFPTASRSRPSCSGSRATSNGATASFARPSAVYLTDEIVDTLLEFAQKPAHRRREAQSHDDDGGSPRLHVAVRTIGAEMGRRHSQSISVDHGQSHKAVWRHHRRVHRRCNPCPVRSPVWREDDAQRAVACAVAMQLAMTSVNEQNNEEDLPDLEMGIGRRGVRNARGARGECSC